DIKQSRALPEPVRERLLARRDRRITAEGVLVLSAHRHRTQERNREDARTRLAELVRSALHAPKPRVATKPTRASKERRLAGKQRRAKVKRARSVARAALRCFGWRVVGAWANEPRMVVVAAPHSSGWDAVWGLVAKVAMG